MHGCGTCAGSPASGRHDRALPPSSRPSYGIVPDGLRQLATVVSGPPSGTSGAGADVEKVRQATELVRGAHPELKVDGPLQYDAAVNQSVAASKMPD